MLTSEHTGANRQTYPPAHGALTPEETSRLAALRERYEVRPEVVELDLDIRRLRFARWLVTHGLLTEEIAGEA